MLPDHATYSEENKSIATEPGVQDMLKRMMDGRFKVFKGCQPLFEEMYLYHMKDGNIIRKDDDVISAVRYAIMMKRYARVFEARKRSTMTKCNGSFNVHRATAGRR